MVPGDYRDSFYGKAQRSHSICRSALTASCRATAGASGRIVLAKDFDLLLGTGSKIYMNVGANQGVKVGDYLRAVRSYEADLRDPVDSLSFKASTAEDTQKVPPSIEGHMFTRTKGPSIHVADMPRRAMGEIVVINVTPTTATGMLVFALEDVHVGDQRGTRSAVIFGRHRQTVFREASAFRIFLSAERSQLLREARRLPQSKDALGAERAAVQSV